MHAAGLSDPIVAISSAWQASPQGIVRLTGTGLPDLLAALGIAPAPDTSRPHHRAAAITTAGITLPTDVFEFPPGRSYTGQHLVELHTCGSPAWLRTVAGALLNAGARRAEPGEFTARACVSGRLRPEQAAGILGLIEAEDAAAARAATRACLGEAARTWDELADELIALIGAVEAGVDFVDEEDIRFIDRTALRDRIDNARAKLARLGGETRALGRAARPHVVLLGSPNAGKSTLFNALLGTRRAIVSPVLGTTRDVLSADLDLGRRRVVLQDTAGLGPPTDELDAAAQDATRAIARQADLVLWVHDGRQPLDEPRPVPIPGVPTLVVATHADAGPARGVADLHVSGTTGTGLAEARQAIAAAVAEGRSGGGAALTREPEAVAACLERARALLEAGTSENIDDPEFVALELRAAWERLGGGKSGPVSERALDWIYGAFCLGK